MRYLLTILFWLLASVARAQGGNCASASLALQDGTTSVTSCGNTTIYLKFVLSGTGTVTFTYTDGTNSFTASQHIQNQGTQYIVPVTPTTTGTYSIISVTDATGCTGTFTGRVDITVDPVATLSLTSPQSSTQQYVCASSPIAPITYSFGGSATGVLLTGPGWLTGSTSGNEFTISGTPPLSGTYQYTVQTTGSPCGNPSLTETITVRAPQVPTFLPHQIGPYCQYSVPAPLPSVSDNSIYGTWSPSTVNTSSVGSSPYTFIPDPGSCATNATVNIVVTASNLSVISNSPVCAGNPLNLVATSGGTTYNWSGPNGFTSTSRTPSIPNVQALHAGTYTVTVNFNNGCISVKSVEVEIKEPPPAPDAIASKQPTCQFPRGEIAVYAPAGQGYSYNINGGNYIQWPQNTFPMLNPGAYNVTVKDASGCISSPTVVVINGSSSISLISAATTVSQTICLNSPITSIVYHVSGTPPEVLTSSLPAGVTGSYDVNSGLFTITGTPGETGMFNFSVWTNSSCVSASGTLTVIGPPKAGFHYLPASVCINSTIAIVPDADQDKSGIYSAPSGLNLNPVTGAIDLPTSTPGSYTVTYTVPSKWGCAEVTASATVSIEPLVPVSVQIAASALSFCSGGTVSFTAFPNNGGANPGFQWQINGVDVAGATTNNFTSNSLSNNAVVTVRMTSDVACGDIQEATSNPITVSVTSVTPRVSITSSSTSICIVGPVIETVGDTVCVVMVMTFETASVVVAQGSFEFIMTDTPSLSFNVEVEKD